MADHVAIVMTISIGNDMAQTASDILENVMTDARAFTVPEVDEDTPAATGLLWWATPMEALRLVGAVNATPIVRGRMLSGTLSIVMVDGTRASTLIGETDRDWNARVVAALTARRGYAPQTDAGVPGAGKSALLAA